MTPANGGRNGSIWRRVAVCGLVGGGVFLATLAIAIPTYAAPRLEVVPLDVRSDTVSTASRATVLNNSSLIGPGLLTSDSNVDLTINTFVTTEDPVSRSVTTLQSAQRTYRTEAGVEAGLVSANIDRVTIDRRSAEPVEGGVATTQAESDKPATNTPRDGFQYKFPFGVEKNSYPYYDGTSRTTNPIKYIDDERVEEGVRLYHFSQTIQPVDLGQSIGKPATLTLPAYKWGIEGEAPTTMNLHYQNTRDIWVEPVTGSVVAVEENPHRWLSPPGFGAAPSVTSLEAHTEFTPETITYLASEASEARTLVMWGTKYGPLCAGLVGLGMAAIGTIMAVRTARRRIRQESLTSV